MKELELTWNRTMRMWWLAAWRGTVGGFVFGAVAGFVGGFIAGFAGYLQYAAIVGGVLGYIVGIVWSAFVLRMMLRKIYSDFRVALVPVAEGVDYSKQASFPPSGQFGRR